MSPYLISNFIKDTPPLCLHAECISVGTSCIVLPSAHSCHVSLAAFLHFEMFLQTFKNCSSHGTLLTVPECDLETMLSARALSACLKFPRSKLRSYDELFGLSPNSQLGFSPSCAQFQLGILFFHRVNRVQ